MINVASESVVQCPACGWSGELAEFEVVLVGARALIHCPSCDANLGTSEHVVDTCLEKAKAPETTLSLD